MKRIDNLLFINCVSVSTGGEHSALLCFFGGKFVRVMYFDVETGW